MYTTNVTSQRDRYFPQLENIFDPLSIVGHITITAKSLLQRLRQLNLTWDQYHPSYTQFGKFSNLNYHILNNWLFLDSHYAFTLHSYNFISIAFSDASETKELVYILDQKIVKDNILLI